MWEPVEFYNDPNIILVLSLALRTSDSFKAKWTVLDSFKSFTYEGFHWFLNKSLIKSQTAMN